MWDMNEVVRVEYKRDYVYFIEFDDGTKGEVDLEYLPTRGPVFEPLRDARVFQSAAVDGGTIVWPNGADIAPETLYHTLIGFEKRAP